MRINKITNGYNKSFKGYNSEVNEYGKHVYRINAPFDPSNEQADITIHSTRENGSGTNIIANEELLYSGTIPQGGLVIDPDKIKGLSPNSPIAYKIYITEKGQTQGRYVEDTGLKTENGVNYIPANLATPNSGGRVLQLMPDIYDPGYHYEEFNEEHPYAISKPSQEARKASETTVRNFGNKGGGNLAGVEADIDNIAENYDKICPTPIWGGDKVSSHGYWNVNNMIISSNMGNLETYRRFMAKLFSKGIICIDDAAITSEGLMGDHVQQMLRHFSNGSQFRRWFKAYGLDNGPLEFAIIPQNDKNVRIRFVNPEYKYSKDGKKVKNPEYNPARETYIQLYDVTQVTEEQINNSTKLIDRYRGKNENELAINSYDDTVEPYYFESDPADLTTKCDEYIKHCKEQGKEVNFDSPEAVLFVGQMPGYVLSKRANGAVYWDAQNDLLKLSYVISGYDEKEIQSIDDPAKRAEIRARIKRSNYEALDYAVQSLVNRFQIVKDTQNLYTARTIRGARTSAEIQELINQGKLPQQALLTDVEIANIISGRYKFKQKGVLPKDDVTVKALMKLPLDSLELGSNTRGLLSTSYFSNRAINEESIGKTRFQMLKEGGEIAPEYYDTYTKIDGLFQKQVKNFADAIIKKVNESSAEKLLDENGNYTEYGEYVIDLLGRDIARYAFLKAIAGDKLKSATMKDEEVTGMLTYNFDELEEFTTLRGLGIPHSTESAEAAALSNIIVSGINKLGLSDVNIVANAVLESIKGTTLIDFAKAEAAVNKAALWLGKRDDAEKDMVDMNAVRNGEQTFDDAWSENIKVQWIINKAIKAACPNYYDVAEITDTDSLMRANYGSGTNVYGDDLYSYDRAKYKKVADAQREFFLKSGATTEANYSYLYSTMMKLYGASGEDGATNPYGRIDDLKRVLGEEFVNNNIDYIRNSLTFIANQDKSRGTHVFASYMGLLRSRLNTFIKDRDGNFTYHHGANRWVRIEAEKELLQVNSFEELPLEAKLNIDNMDYFRTVTPQAIAVSKLMREAISETVHDDEMKAKLNNALLDMVNGNYLSSKELGEKVGETYRRKGERIDFQTIKDVPELTNLEAALTKVAQESGMYLGDNFGAIIARANKQDLVEQAAVRGDFDTKDPAFEREDNIKRYHEIFGYDNNDYMKFSPYTLSIATLLMLAYKDVLADKADLETFKAGLRKFVETYDRAFVEAHTKPMPKLETNAMHMEKVGLGYREIHTVIEMLLKQVEYNTGESIPKDQRDKIMQDMFSNTTDGAFQKSLMVWAASAALPGATMIPDGERFGQTGMEDPKNTSLQGRNTSLRSQLEEGVLSEQIKERYRRANEVAGLRKLPGMDPVNNGTPRMIETSDPNVIACLYQTADGHYAVTMINAKDINVENRAVYNGCNDDALDTINNSNPHVPKQNKLDLAYIALPFALPAGLVFVNALGEAKDKAKYVVQRMKDGIYRIVNKNGQSISMNGSTAKYGSMFLVEESQYNKDLVLRQAKAVAKKAAKVAFKGNSLNKQYNIVSNPYAKTNKTDLGKNLSIISK